ncbi:Protein kinase domain-containing protein [Cinnamomum micranthum f. kanehirae]|uniref:non-specific serine/threonine protein kinase n=1 Tax=Cinnamomum micranthum f. kanehirae TaxID=337451 RepID=A0A3S3PVV4_9MAGN|nr:Protein kinase domain-containing protein [Cinnamomum micranthum f. kanehirae]
MGTCTSVIKNCSFRSRSSSRNNNNNNSNNTHNQKEDNHPPTAQTTIATTLENPQQQQQQTTHKNLQQPVYKGNRKRPMGVVPCGKRTEFGYLKDFNNHYTIGKLLGHGQFGYTFAATVKANGDCVAVKRIDKNKMILPIAVEDVKREVKILQALAGHENVVRFHNAFEDDSFVYIVMELCEGGELLDRILAKKDKCYTEKDAAVVVRQMLKVAAECHLHGLVHRDMKPENFLFKSTEEDSPLKATDFGLSDFIKPGRKFKDIVGSAYYVAPEVLKRKSGPESDVWSIGVITYILLCGRRPFWDKTQDGVFKQVLRSKPDFSRKPWPSISNSAKDFIKKLLVKDPRARLTAAQALSYPWVREGGDALEIPLDISVLSNMRQFVRFSRLKQIALRALATTLNEEEKADLRDQFDAIDVDKSGTISLEEMKHVCIPIPFTEFHEFNISFATRALTLLEGAHCHNHKALAKDLPWKLKEPRVQEILQAIDSNTDGFVDFSEFVAAALHVHQLEEHDSEKWQQRSQAAFEKFDVDRDGYITPEELKMHTGLKGSVEPLLEEADIDKDGKISLPEFRRLLISASVDSQNVPNTCGLKMLRRCKP